nr:DUF192 domain-containing protein [Pseudomonas sp.]
MTTGRHPGAAHTGSPVRVTWRLARSFTQRLRGLLNSPPPPAGTALLIARCKAVHTIGMRYPIDVIFVSRSGRVLRVYPHVMPQRARMCCRAWGVAELAAGEAKRLGIVKHVRLVLPG